MTNKFRNYCIVVMVNTVGVLDEIRKVCESEPQHLNATGILIATFSSLFEPNELTEWFKENNRNFLIFDLDKKSSGVNLLRKEMHEGLFGFLNDVDTMTEEFVKTIELSSENRNTETTIKVKPKNILDQSKIERMGVSERQLILNELIDGGLEKLSEHDRNLLPLLAK